MSTPAMYHLVNALLGMPTHQAFPGLTRDQRHAIRTLVTMVESHAPIIDVTDVWRLLVRQQDATRAVMDAAHIEALCRPLQDPATLRLPWPQALLTCAFSPAHSTLWGMRCKPESPTDFQISTIAVVSDHGQMHPVELQTQPPCPEMVVGEVAMALAGARNAQWIETGPNHATRRRLPAVAGVQFRHIDIDMNAPKRVSSDRSLAAPKVATATPWHHRRGHWAFYGQGNPLFGRAGEHGWYWRPYVEVGDKAHGEIIQDYSIRGNLPQDYAA